MILKLFFGVTNNLPQRITEHYLNRDKQDSFAGKYKCYNLLYWESFKYIDKAIQREKVIKGWTRKKKEFLITSENPEWRFLNTDVFEQWPPSIDAFMRGNGLDSSLHSE